MGSDEQGAEDDDVIVVSEETVLQAARNKGFRITESSDGIAWRIAHGRKVAYLPRTFGINGYTEAQMAMIEDAFHECGVDLFPLERNLH